MKKPTHTDDLVEILLQRTLNLVRREGRDLSLRQMAVLFACDAAEDLQTVRGLARYLEIAKPAVTRAVDRLEAAGLVQRQPDPSDRRSVLIAPTASGRRYSLQFLGRASAGSKALAPKVRPSEVTAGPEHLDTALLIPDQVREARDLLDWSQSHLASRAEMTTQSVTKFERGTLQLSPDDLHAIRGALETAGVIFVDENGHGPGVRLMKAGQ